MSMSANAGKLTVGFILKADVRDEIYTRQLSARNHDPSYVFISNQLPRVRGQLVRYNYLSL
jgi:hypothetical protein